MSQPPVVEPDVDEERERSTRIPEFLCMLSFGWGTGTLPGTSLPLTEVMAGVMVATALTRPSKVRVPAWFWTGLLGLGALFLLSSYLNDILPTRRLLHLALFIALASFLASGRLHAISVARGAVIGLGAGVGLSLLGFGTSAYAGRLTGLYGDPNQLGMYITILGTLAVGLGISANNYKRYGLIALLGFGVFRTVSRTSMLAVAFAGVWVAFAKRFGRGVGIIVVLVMLNVVSRLSETDVATGQFADREGSDQLRERIKVLEQIAVAQNPIFGSGPGSARVDVDGDPFFFHSSYLALRQEAGWVGLLCFCAVGLFLFWKLTGLSSDLRNGWIEAALIGAAVCAVNLGEVLLDLPMAIALGIAMHHVAANTPHESPPDSEVPPGARSAVA